MIAERDTKLEARIETVAIDFAQVVIYAGGAKHRTGDAGVDRQLGRELADFLSTREQDII